MRAWALCVASLLAGPPLAVAKGKVPSCPPESGKELAREAQASGWVHLVCGDEGFMDGAHLLPVNGRVIDYLRDGQVLRDLPYQTRHLHGRARSWHDNGKLRSEGQYAAGYQAGEWKSWHDNGKPDDVQHFAEAGVKHGDFHAWYPDGKKKSEERFDNGVQVGVARTWHANGQLASEEPHGGDRGFLEGERRTWHPNGKPESVGAWKGGSQHGRLQTFHPDGTPESDQTYADAKQHGAASEWHPNGKLKEQGTWERGQKVGAWKTFREDGTPLLEETWKTGEQDGPRTEFGEDGKPRLVCQVATLSYVTPVGPWETKTQRAPAYWGLCTQYGAGGTFGGAGCFLGTKHAVWQAAEEAVASASPCATEAHAQSLCDTACDRAGACDTPKAGAAAVAMCKTVCRTELGAKNPARGAWATVFAQCGTGSCDEIKTCMQAIQQR